MTGQALSLQTCGSEKQGWGPLDGGREFEDDTLRGSLELLREVPARPPSCSPRNEGQTPSRPLSLGGG